MDDLNTKIALRLQNVADEVFEELAPLLPYGSYTANQVYEFFTKVDGKNKKFSDIMSGLPKVCHEEVSIKVESFKCCVPKYMLYKILHQFEKLASIGAKLRKKFIREANIEKEDVSFIVEITKAMMPMTKQVDGKDSLRPTLQRVALDYEKGYVVATDGHLLSAQKAVYRAVIAKEGVSKKPVLVSPSIFKQCLGDTLVSATEKNGFPDKYRYQSDGGYYEEDAVGRFPNWQAVVPRELFRSGRITLRKEDVKRFMKFAKAAEKNGDADADGKRLLMQTKGSSLYLIYWKDGVQQESLFELDEEPGAITICFCPKYLGLLDGWNGTMWITDRSRAVIFDKNETSDFYLLTPRILPDGVDIQDGINGTKVSFDERHTEYRNLTDCKQTSKQKSEIITQKSLFMAAERYEGTQPFYTLEEIERGEFKIKGSHDSELVLFLRTAAHYIRRQGAELQAEFSDYCRDQFTGKDWRNLVPLEEMALAEMFEGFLTSKGINDIPDVEFEDAIEEVTEEEENQFEDNHEMVEVPAVVEEVEAEEVTEEPESYTFCITGTLDKSRKFYQEEIEKRGWRLASKMSTSVDILVYGESNNEAASNKIKQAIKHGTKAICAEEFYRMLEEHPVEAEEVTEEVIEEAVEVIEEAAIKPMAIEREIVPTLELETSEGTLIVAGESYFHKLYDEDEGCFRSEAAEAKFNEIDAFISDELITADELDYAAIAQAVGEFMEEVEQAS